MEVEAHNLDGGQKVAWIENCKISMGWYQPIGPPVRQVEASSA